MARQTSEQKKTVESGDVALPWSVGGSDLRAVVFDGVNRLLGLALKVCNFDDTRREFALVAWDVSVFNDEEAI